MNASRWVVTAVVLLLLLASPSAAPSASESVDRPGTHPAPGAGVDVDTATWVGDGNTSVNLSAVHDTGVTGEGVDVGIIGGSFDVGGSTVANQVVGSRQFSTGGVARLGGDRSHGTAVAEVVARTAPGAEVYLAGVGLRTSPSEYEAAVDWLLARDVDVIVDAASYFPRSGAAAERISAIASNATERGAVFVTSAGNYATHHWSGRVRGDGWVEFANGTQANPLGDGPVAGRVTLRLSWRGSADLDLYLYRYREHGSDPVVAKSAGTQRGNGTHVESIDVFVPDGRYYVAVHAPSEIGPTRIDLFAGQHRLRYTVSWNSILAPATAPNVIAVGATSRADGLAAYSSRGPKLDIAAPGILPTRSTGRFEGTSAAAPFVAGTVALMEAQNGDLTPAEAERILETTAERSGGVLRVAPAAAVAAANGTATRADRPALPRPCGRSSIVQRSVTPEEIVVTTTNSPDDG